MGGALAQQASSIHCASTRRGSSCLALGKWRQEGQEFKAILSYVSPYLRKQTDIESERVQRVRRLLPSLAEFSAQDLQSGKKKLAPMVL